MQMAQNILETPASWVIRNKETRAVICETFNRRAVEQLLTDKYEAVPIARYLAEVNRAAQEGGR